MINIKKLLTKSPRTLEASLSRSTTLLEDFGEGSFIVFKDTHPLSIYQAKERVYKCDCETCNYEEWAFEKVNPLLALIRGVKPIMLPDNWYAIQAETRKSVAERAISTALS